MRGAVLYGPRDVRIDERPDPTHHRADGCGHPAVGDLHLRVGSLALSGSQRRERAGPHGPRVLRHRRRGRPRRHLDQAGTVRHRLVCRLRQHVSALSGGLPDVVRASAVGRRCAGAVPARAAGGWHAGRDAGTALLDQVPSFLAVSDVLGTGWFAADAANVKPGATVVVVGDGAVGLLGVLSAKQMGAERIIAMSRHEARQTLAREFGATDIVTERGDEGVARVKELTKGVGADSVLECVGTQESMTQAIQLHATWRIDQLCRRPARRRARRREAVLHARASARWPRSGAPLPSQAH